MPHRLTSGLDAFAAQFQAQLAHDGVPSNENAIVLYLALGFQSAYALAPGAIIFERRITGGRIDLWVSPLELAVEVKFRRPIPSGKTLPATQLFGDLLADFNKLARETARQRLVVLATDAAGLIYLDGGGGKLLPLTEQAKASIGVDELPRLAKTAATRAEADGPWTPLTAELIWRREAAPWHLLAWLVAPQADGSVP